MEDEIEMIKAAFGATGLNVKNKYAELKKFDLKDAFSLPIEFREIIYEDAIIAGSKYDETDFSDMETTIENPIYVITVESKKIPAIYLVSNNHIVVIIAVLEEDYITINHYLKFAFEREHIDDLIGNRPEELE